MIAFSKSEPDRQAGVDPDRSACADKEITASIIPDGGGLLFGEVPGTFVRPKTGGGSPSICAVVVEILLVGEIGGRGGGDGGIQWGSKCGLSWRG